MLNSRVGSWPYPQTLDYVGKACQGQLIAKIRKLTAVKRFKGIGPFKVLHSRVGSWPYPQNIILGWKGLAGKNALAYYKNP